MEQFSFENLDITRASNETITELGEVLWHFTSVHCKEDLDIAEKYRESVDALVDSFNPKQKEWFEEYQKMVTDELWLAEQRRFVCGFKTAMRLALESMK
mgnify:FL=1